MEVGSLTELFVRNLKMWRWHLGISQRDVAVMSGVSESYIHAVELMDISPTLGLLERLAGALEVPAWTLLCEDGDLEGGDGGWGDQMSCRFRREVWALVDGLFADARRGRRI